MPVMPDYGPGLGPGIDAFFENQMRRKLFDLQTQGMQDAHDAQQASMIANYGYEPPTTTRTPIPQNQSFLGKIHDRIFGVPAQPAPTQAGDVAPTAPQIDTGAFRSMIANMGGPSGAASAMPVTTTPGAPRRNAVLPVDQVTNPGDLFTQNLTASFQNAGGAGQRTPAAATMSRAGVGAGNIPGNPNAGGGSRTVADAQNDFLSSLEAAPRVTLANGGTIQPYAGLIRQLRLEQAKAQINADKTVNVSDRTGATARNTAGTLRDYREINTPRLGDANYAPAVADVEYQKALATLPVDTQKMINQSALSLKNATTIEQLRGSIQSMLQHNQQQFDLGKMGLEQKFQADQLVKRLGGEFLNQSYLENQRARGTLSGKALAPSPATTAPSSNLLGGGGLFGDLIPPGRP